MEAIAWFSLFWSNPFAREGRESCLLAVPCERPRLHAWHGVSCRSSLVLYTPCDTEIPLQRRRKGRRSIGRDKSESVELGQKEASGNLIKEAAKREEGSHPASTNPFIQGMRR